MLNFLNINGKKMKDSKFHQVKVMLNFLNILMVKKK